jgi:hypothetical protein
MRPSAALKTAGRLLGMMGCYLMINLDGGRNTPHPIPPYNDIAVF